MNASRDDDRPAPALEPKLQAHIGRQLRQLYDQMVSEPVPDRFKALLDRLEGLETKPDAEASAPEAIDTPVRASEAPR
jgi:hypothetical protein